MQNKSDRLAEDIRTRNKLKEMSESSGFNELTETEREMAAFLVKYGIKALMDELVKRANESFSSCCDENGLYKGIEWRDSK